MTVGLPFIAPSPSSSDHHSFLTSTIPTPSPSPSPAPPPAPTPAPTPAPDLVRLVVSPSLTLLLLPSAHLSLSTAGALWHAGSALVQYLVQHPEVVRGKKVLEMGAGCGMAGIVAAAMGATCVVISDKAEEGEGEGEREKEKEGEREGANVVTWRDHIRRIIEVNRERVRKYRRKTQRAAANNVNTGNQANEHENTSPCPRDYHESDGIGDSDHTCNCNCDCHIQVYAASLSFGQGRPHFAPLEQQYMQSIQNCTCTRTWTANAGSTAGSTRSNIDVDDGTGVEQDELAEQDQKIQIPTVFDVVLGADIGYDLTLHEPIVDTIKQLATAKQEQVVAMQARANSPLSSGSEIEESTRPSVNASVNECPSATSFSSDSTTGDLSTHCTCSIHDLRTTGKTHSQDMDAMCSDIRVGGVISHATSKECQGSQCSQDSDIPKMRALLVEEVRWKDIHSWYLESIRQGLMDIQDQSQGQAEDGSGNGDGDDGDHGRSRGRPVVSIETKTLNDPSMVQAQAKVKFASCTGEQHDKASQERTVWLDHISEKPILLHDVSIEFSS